MDVRVTSEGGGGEGEELSSQTPCVLPEWSKIRKVCVCVSLCMIQPHYKVRTCMYVGQIVVNSSRHWPMTLDLSEGSGSLR